MTILGNGNVKFEIQVLIQNFISDDKCILTLESTTSSDEEVPIKYVCRTTSTNYWWVGLNQSNDFQ